MVWLKCQRCGWAWDYQGGSVWYATCSQCHRSVRIDDRSRISEEEGLRIRSNFRKEREKESEE